MTETKPATDFDELRLDIERCAAVLHTKSVVLPSNLLDPKEMRELGKELDHAVMEARKNARSLVEGHRKEFPASPLFSSCSLLRPLGQNRRELQVTQALGWLLDPKGEHGFGGLLLRAFLSTISDKDEAARVVSSAVDGDISVYTEFALNESCRADILITAGGSAVVVEAKIDAAEGQSQTDRYSRDFGKRYAVCAYVYLTPNGKQPASVHFTSVRYLEVARAMIRVLPTAGHAEGFHYARYYLAGILEEFCDISPSSNLDEVLHNNSFAIETLLQGRTHE